MVVDTLHLVQWFQRQKGQIGMEFSPLAPMSRENGANGDLMTLCESIVAIMDDVSSGCPLQQLQLGDEILDRMID